MDPLYEALTLFHKRHFEKCAGICTDLLGKNPRDQNWNTVVPILSAAAAESTLPTDTAVQQPVGTPRVNVTPTPSSPPSPLPSLPPPPPPPPPSSSSPPPAPTQSIDVISMTDRVNELENYVRAQLNEVETMIDDMYGDLRMLRARLGQDMSTFQNSLSAILNRRISAAPRLTLMQSSTAFLSVPPPAFQQQPILADHNHLTPLDDARQPQAGTALTPIGDDVQQPGAETLHMSGYPYNRIDCSFCLGPGFSYPVVDGTFSSTINRAKTLAAIDVLSRALPTLKHIIADLEEAAARPYYRTGQIFAQNVWRLMMRELSHIVDTGVATVETAECHARYPTAIWALKMQALTAQIMVDDIEAEEEGIAEALLDNDTIAQSARPGTSLKTSATAQTPGQGLRPRTESGRPVSGVVRPGTQSGRATSLEQILKTPRTASSARPVTSQSARTVRLGTASMMTQPDGPFIQIARLNMSKYAADERVAKPLFQYIFYHENDVRNALDLAVEATKAAKFKDWWWKVQLGKCYFLLGLIRDAEQQLRSALKQTPTIEGFLRLARVYIRLDQPLNALDVCQTGLNTFPQEVTLLTEVARVLEALNKIPASVSYYREILQKDATNVEAIACIAVNYFYNDQPEVALRFYRRLLQMGLYNAELFNNIGLCCFYCQQYDMTVSCFERALSLAIDETAADVWYNIGNISIALGDIKLSSQCLRLAVSVDSNHAPAYNNLGVLEHNNGNISQAQAFFQAAASIAPYLYEPDYNHAMITNSVGDLQTSYIVIQKALQAYPGHSSSLQLLKELQKHFNNL